MNIAAIANPATAGAAEQISDLAARRAPSSRKALSGAALRSAAPEEQRKAVAQQFEAILVRQMLNKTMSSMLGSEKSGPAANVYGDMLTDTFAQQLTSGPGLGLSRLLEKQLAPRGATVDPTLAAKFTSTSESNP